MQISELGIVSLRITVVMPKARPLDQATPVRLIALLRITYFICCRVKFLVYLILLESEYEQEMS